MRIHFTIILLIFSALNHFAQSSSSLHSFNMDFSGYVVNLPVYQVNNKSLVNTFNLENSQFLNLTRTRLRPTLNIGSKTRINFEYEIAALYINTGNSIFISTPQKSSHQIIDLTWTPVNERNLSVTHFIDRLSLRQSFEWGNIEVGRQRIQWGSGRIWNPTDLFNPINPALFYKIEKDGADIISLKYIFGNFTDIDLVFNAAENFSESNYGFRFRTNFNEYDISLMGGRFDKRIVAGLDIAGNFFDAGLRGEGIFSADENLLNNNFIKFIVGADYQFTSKLYGVIEYHFNGEGKKDKSEYELLKLVNNKIINLSKNYLYEGLIFQYHPLITFTLSNNTNLNDGSGYLSILANYSLTENIYINVGTQILYGNDFTEYWYYSKSFYAQGEYYF
ncbi:MAG: hypothetical protein KJ571_02615 [Bacteroidetes bacterium]|nr:hypothetical protein [Bacteroidota bacterium]